MRSELEKILQADRTYSLSDLAHVYNIASRLHKESVDASHRGYAELEQEKPDLESEK